MRGIFSTCTLYNTVRQSVLGDHKNYRFGDKSQIKFIGSTTQTIETLAGHSSATHSHPGHS